MRRRSLRQALAEPSTTSFTSAASSGGSAGSRQSLNGDLAMALAEPADHPAAAAAAAASAGPSAAEVAALLLQRGHPRNFGGGGGGGGLGEEGELGITSRGQSTASMELELGLGPEFQGLQGRLPLMSAEEIGGPGAEEPLGPAGQPGVVSGGREDGGGNAAADHPGGPMGSPIGGESSYCSSEQGSSCGTRLSGDGGEDEVGCYIDLHEGEEDPFAEFDRPPDPEAYRALHSATASPEKDYR